MPTAATKESVAYLSMEFAVDSKLPIYSGGLGVLAGDHLKAANDLGLPVIGIGLFYHYGYFTQEIKPDGWQTEFYPRLNPQEAGLELVIDSQDKPIRVQVPIEDRLVEAQAWKYQVGEVPLYLLSTDVLENSNEDRLITAHLYGAAEIWDKQTRVRQELVLGIGGYRLVERLALEGLEPNIGVYHLNEGHSAFLPIPRFEDLVAGGLSEEDAFAEIQRTQMFTTHTPVAAGQDIFPEEVVDRELHPYLRLLGEHRVTTLKDRANHLEGMPEGSWSQTQFAMKTSRVTTAVSKPHSETAATLWKMDKVDYVTNGVHISWMDPKLRTLIDPGTDRFVREHTDPDYLRWRMEQIDPDEFRQLRNRNRADLTAFANRYIGEQLFDPDTLTVGFARRAATYKRLDLLAKDPDRLLEIIDNPDRPIQFIMAGKAHPQDTAGKEIIQRMVQLSQDPRFKGRILFIPNYDTDIAHHLVIGSDVWLNTPKKGEEASGTSGMKSAMNGGRQWSIDDGWMGEVPQKLYFRILDDSNPEVVASRMYRMLNETIAPQFYGKDGKPISPKWGRHALTSMTYIIPRFSAARMSREYFDRFYKPMLAEKPFVLQPQAVAAA